MLLLYTGNVSLCLLLKYVHYLSFHIAWIKSVNNLQCSSQTVLLLWTLKSFKFLMFLNNRLDPGAQLPARNNEHQSRGGILTCDYVHFIITVLKNHYGITKLSLQVKPSAGYIFLADISCQKIWLARDYC